MAGEWCDLRLEELAAPTKNALVGGPFGSDLVSADYVRIGVPVIRGENLSVGRWVGGEFAYVSAAKARQLFANTAGALDLVFTQRGANHYRQVALVPIDAGQRFLISQSQMKITVDRAKADPLFVYYLFRSPEQQEYLRRHAIQTGVPHTNLSILRSVPLCVPPLDVQRPIAHILGMLDDKIELNRRISETPEAMVRALFKSWFVDFDPVRAKMEGRDPGLPKPLADLFPDRLVDSELGEIPAGWKADTLGALAALNPDSWTNDGYPDVISYVDLSNTKWGRIEAVTQYARADAPSRAQRILRHGDTIVGTVRPGNGSYALVTEDGLTGSTGFAVLRSKQLEYTEFVYLAATRPENIEALSHIADGGAYPAVRPDVVAATPIAAPPADVLTLFSRATQALLAGLARNERESATLAALPDALLPKLISGELRVKDAERLAGRMA